MDSDRFDDLVRTLGARLPRRRALGVLSTLAVGLAARLGGADAIANNKKNKKNNKNNQGDKNNKGDKKDDDKRRCKPPNSQPCGPGCTDPVNRPCCNGVPCAAGQHCCPGGHCCPNGHGCTDPPDLCCGSTRTCGNQCCEQDGNPCDTRFSPPECCPGNRICGAACCLNGEGCDRSVNPPRCCPVERTCGGACCPEGQLCTFDTGVPRCCPQNRTCGDVCCPGADYHCCNERADGTGTMRCCPPNREVCAYDGVAGKLSCCPASAPAGCGVGRCCKPEPTETCCVHAEYPGPGKCCQSNETCHAGGDIVVLNRILQVDPPACCAAGFTPCHGECCRDAPSIVCCTESHGVGGGASSFCYNTSSESTCEPFCTCQ